MGGFRAAQGAGREPLPRTGQHQRRCKWVAMPQAHCQRPSAASRRTASSSEGGVGGASSLRQRAWHRQTCRHQRRQEEPHAWRCEKHQRLHPCVVFHRGPRRQRVLMPPPIGEDVPPHARGPSPAQQRSGQPAQRRVPPRVHGAAPSASEGSGMKLKAKLNTTNLSQDGSQHEMAPGETRTNLRFEAPEA